MGRIIQPIGDKIIPKRKKNPSHKMWMGLEDHFPPFKINPKLSLNSILTSSGVRGPNPSSAAYSFSFIAEAEISDVDCVNTYIDCSAALTVAEHDTLVCISSYADDTGTTTTVGTAASPDLFTMETETVFSGGNSRISAGVLLDSAAGTLTFRQTLGKVVAQRSLFVLQFRKTGGTAAKDGTATGTAPAPGSLDVATGTFSTTTAGSVAVAGEYDSNLKHGSSPLIGGAVTGNYLRTTEAHPKAWYTIFTEEKSNITANLTLNADAYWVACVLAIKAT